MPSKTLRQHNLMAMVANNPKAAKRLGIPQSVGEEYIKADKGRKFGSGSKSRPTLQKINRPKTAHGQDKLYKDGGSVMKKLFKGKESYSEELKEAKAIKSGKITPQQYARGEKMEDEMKKPKRMNAGGMGGMSDDERARRYNAEEKRTTPTPKEAAEMEKMRRERQMLETQKRKNEKPEGYKSGGMVKSRGDGIAQRGKTRGKVC